MEWLAGRIMSSKHLVERHSQAIDIGARASLRLPKLLRGSITNRLIVSSIFCLTRFEMPGNTKVNKVDLTRRSDHYVTWLEVAKDDRWLMSMQIVEDST